MSTTLNIPCRRQCLNYHPTAEEDHEYLRDLVFELSAESLQALDVFVKQELERREKL